MEINIELTEKDLRELVKQKIESLINTSVDTNMIHIQVKSKQNYKSEWEETAFKATYKKY